MFTRLLVIAMLVSPVIAWAISESVFISEVYFNTDTDGLVFIELYNKKHSNLDIDGWVIKVLDEDMDTITLPDEAVIPGYGFYLIGRSADKDSWSGETYSPDYYADVDLGYFDNRGAIELLDDTHQSLDKLGWGDCSQNYYEHQP
ncbi:MAG: lamin tail domain-containing protein, partial [bacterium]|nr:lamin tail domain-containing protein [bacterium]